jgi:aminoglycoside/choline kinase family phosphotransferase
MEETHVAPTTSSAQKTDLLLRQTRRHFPLLEQESVEIAPIEKGGSDRKFYRVRSTPDQTLILVKYNLEREENRHYVQIAQFLGSHGIRVPKIYFHDDAEGLIWIEDLGETDLYGYREESWLVRRALYLSALDEMAKIHRLPVAAAETITGCLAGEFNAALYLWEQNYFFENALGRYFGLDEKQWREIAALPALHEIAVRLGDKPMVLVHRDFQSQNVIVRDAQAHLIDFQGMRPGQAEYDLASLLFDPYVSISATEQTELLAHYRATQMGNGHRLAADFDETLQLCAMQRLMQALGAYGFLGLVKGHKDFLQYIPKAVRSLRDVVAKIDNLKPLESFLDRICYTE